MALIVEDGSGKADAESYVSVADAIAYLVKRGDSTFAEAGTVKQEAALRNAADYMTSLFRYRWGGFRMTTSQRLDWPRQAVPIIDVAFGYQAMPSYYPVDQVPTAIGEACADLALRALNGPLQPDISRVKRSVKIGPITVDYDPNAAVTTTLTAVQTKLAPFFRGQGMRTSLVRT